MSMLTLRNTSDSNTACLCIQGEPQKDKRNVKLSNKNFLLETITEEYPSKQTLGLINVIVSPCMLLFCSPCVSIVVIVDITVFNAHPVSYYCSPCMLLLFPLKVIIVHPLCYYFSPCMLLLFPLYVIVMIKI